MLPSVSFAMTAITIIQEHWHFKNGPLNGNKPRSNGGRISNSTKIQLLKNFKFHKRRKHSVYVIFLLFEIF